MPDANGHSWAGLGPRSCRFCGAAEGSKAVWEPCSKAYKAARGINSKEPLDDCYCACHHNTDSRVLCGHCQ